MTAKAVRQSLIDQLTAKGMTSAYYIDKVDEYMTHWKIHQDCWKDIKKRGLRVTVTSGNGFEKDCENESRKSMNDESRTMLSILKTLGLEEPTAKVADDGSDYM
jgi:hypothetical protein